MYNIKQANGMCFIKLDIIYVVHTSSFTFCIFVIFVDICFLCYL